MTLLRHRRVPMRRVWVVVLLLGLVVLGVPDSARAGAAEAAADRLHAGGAAAHCPGPQRPSAARASSFSTSPSVARKRRLGRRARRARSLARSRASRQCLAPQRCRCIVGRYRGSADRRSPRAPGRLRVVRAGPDGGTRGRRRHGLRDGTSTPGGDDRRGAVGSTARVAARCRRARTPRGNRPALSRSVTACVPEREDGRTVGLGVQPSSVPRELSGTKPPRFEQPVMLVHTGIPKGARRSEDTLRRGE